MIVRPLIAACVWLVVTVAGWAETPAAKKLIEFGWDMPTPDQLRANIGVYENLPFDGIGVKLPMGQEIFTKTPYPDADYQIQRDILADINFTNLTDNFLVMWGTAEDGWLWTNEADWQAAEINIGNFARTHRRWLLQ